MSSEPMVDAGWNGAPGTATCPAMAGLPPGALAEVAAYFQALAEPMRLAILNRLRDGEHSVGDIAQACGSTSANVSRHLAQLVRHGLVAREHRGTCVYHRIADPRVYALCDLVCGSVARRLAGSARTGALLAGADARAGDLRPGRRRPGPASG